MSECQICARDIKDSKGFIAHHGYHRPGDGWQTASCIGARHVSYVKGRDVLPLAIEHMKTYLKNREEHLANLKAGTAPIYAYRPRGSREPLKVLEPDPRPYSQYDTALKNAIWHTERDIKSAQQELYRLQARYNNWKPIKEVC